jgi:hypothetical protein
MSVDQAISAYGKLASYVFSKTKSRFQEGTFKATRLEAAMTDVVAAALQIKRAEAIQTRMINKEFPDGAKG